MSFDDIREPWTFYLGDGPVIAAAIHSGSDLRPQVAQHLAISAVERFREEDPYTGEWASVGDSRVVVHRSRFEVDLNRPRDGAVYAAPIDCWNLKVSEGPIPREVIDESLRLYDRFYVEMDRLLEEAVTRWGRVLVLDLHSYNHRRTGSAADPAKNPDVNIGTIGAGRPEWGPLIDRFAAALRRFEVGGRPLDVKENVKFRGGHLVRWIADRFPSACPLAIEVKKIYMDELTGELDEPAWRQIHRALEAAATSCRQELGRTQKQWDPARAGPTYKTDLLPTVDPRAGAPRAARRRLPRRRRAGCPGSRCTPARAGPPRHGGQVPGRRWGRRRAARPPGSPGDRPSASEGCQHL